MPDWSDIDSETYVTTASIGQPDNPVDLFASAEGFSLEEFMGEETRAYVGELHIQTDSGEYVLTAEDGTVVVEYRGEEDD